jgi:hypothetical protein
MFTLRLNEIMGTIGMKLTRTFAMLCVAASISIPAQAQTPITNTQVIEMVKAGLPDDVVVGAIKSGGKPLDASPMALVALKKAGVSDVVLRAVITSTGTTVTDATTPRASANPMSSNQMPDTSIYGGNGGVLMIDGSTQTNLTLTPISYRMGMMRMFTGNNLGKVIAIIKSGPATIRSHSHRPIFQISAGVSDAPQNSWGIVPLEGGGKSLKFDYHSVLNMSKAKLIPVTYKKIASGQFVNSWLVTPETDLPSGEYVVISGNEGGVQPYQFGVE